MRKTEPTKKWLNVAEISIHLGISKESVYRFLARQKSKRIPAHRIGKLWKFAPQEVDVWIKQGNACENKNH